MARSKQFASQLDLSKLASPHNLFHLTPIQYATDHVPSAPVYLTPPLASFPAVATAANEHILSNAIDLHPLSARLPYRSSLGTVRESKAWRSNLITTAKILELLAADKSTADMEVEQGITLAKLASHELRPGLENRIALATPYMFPGCDESRIALIAVTMVMYFIFDDKVEESYDAALEPTKDDFLFRFRAKDEDGHDSNYKTSLQRYLNWVIEELAREDSLGGNGGAEMLRALHQAFVCVHPPPGDFSSIESYLDFRHMNVGADYVVAAAKFSIRSSVDSKDPRFAQYLRLISNHLGIINDMASYDKELRAFKDGKTRDMINIVAIIKRLLSLPTDDSAKVSTYAYLLQLEESIMDEVRRLSIEEKIADEEWWFLEAVFMAATGNTFFCMVSSRYGDEAVKIKPFIKLEEANGWKSPGMLAV